MSQLFEYVALGTLVSSQRVREVGFFTRIGSGLGMDKPNMEFVKVLRSMRCTHYLLSLTIEADLDFVVHEHHVPDEE